MQVKLQSTRSSGMVEKICGVLEGFVDDLDAVRRKVKQIYADLAELRISHSRAALELQKLTQRQKGGCLNRGGGRHSSPSFTKELHGELDQIQSPLPC